MTRGRVALGQVATFGADGVGDESGTDEPAKDGAPEAVAQEALERGRQDQGQQDLKEPCDFELESSSRDLLTDLVRRYISPGSRILKVGRRGIQDIPALNKCRQLDITDVRSSDEFHGSHPFDAAILWDQLQKISDPLRFLDRIKASLTHDAPLVIRVPCYGDVDSLIKSFRSEFLFRAVHASFFTRYNLIHLLWRGGWFILEECPEPALGSLTVVAQAAQDSQWSFKAR